MTKTKALDRAKELHQEIIDQRRDFHMHPELGFDLERTAGIVAKQLNSLGLKVKTGIGKIGVYADLDVPNAKRRIALRADMDALPIQELNDIPYKSKNANKAHMCGHDAHTAMLLGAAKILSSLKDDLTVNVRFIFQPNEEAWPGGAPAMIQDGVLDGVDEIYALHVWPTIDAGSFGICVGPAMAQPDAFDITITGRGGHAAAPQKAIDPIVATSHLIQALQTIISRNVDAHDNAVLTVTQVHGGTCYNVIPDDCTITGTVRTYDKKVQTHIRNRIQEIAEGTALAFNARAEVKYLEAYPVTFNHEKNALIAKNCTTRLVGSDHVIYPGQRAMFGEDFAYYAQQIPGCFVQLGCRNTGKDITRMLHDPRFNIDEDCLIYGTAFFVDLIVNEMNNL